MSGSVASGPFLPAEIVACRRYCGYGPPRATVPDIVGITLAGLDDDYIAVVRTFLVNLPLLENDIPATRAKLSIDQAAVFKRNAAEVAERQGLYRDLRLRLCATLGIESGPFMNLVLPGVFVV